MMKFYFHKQSSRWIIFLLYFFIFLFSGHAGAQLTRPSLPDSLFPTYYHQRVTHFRTLPQTAGDIIFIGNSITDGAEWSELFADSRIKNRGISGDVSAGVINRLDEITDRQPAKVFLLIGVNDLARNISTDSLLENILWIADYLKQQTPLTQLYVQSLLPVNDYYGMFTTHTDKGGQITAINQQLQQQASLHHYTFINLNLFFRDTNGKMNLRYTNDGLHLKGEGYLLWKHLIYPYVFDLQAKPSLIPLPQQLQWDNNFFPLFSCKRIILKDIILQKEAIELQQRFLEKGLVFTITNTAKENEPYIELRLGKISAPQLAEEAYHLEVTSQSVIITASTSHGIFNGIQTLRQLIRDNVMIDACTITDWPAFSWRGYMVDVGRNYQSPDLLKQQIDIMSYYKLNIFHLHLTEDIAWRLAVKQYSQLTAPENMLRDKGEFYSEGELKELITFCKERYIILVPEIDMPGHSAAFTRAMGVDMQSEEGTVIVKNILTQFCKTYDVPYLHIGGDEVKIKNLSFLPGITALVHAAGKQAIGWDPGGNYGQYTIRQLWMKEGAKNPDAQYIDSRHLYLNHMDPLESVVTIFNRKIGDRAKTDAAVLGGTICLWNDRRVQQQEDVLKMNPVYPAMLTFAERAWRGGGYQGWITNIMAKDSEKIQAFLSFEQRLMDQKQMYFTHLSFPYAAQSYLRWQLYGPYQNDGALFKSFAPEQPDFTFKNAAVEVTGGTIILRHFWYPLVTGALQDPKENSTWYAVTKIWSDTAQFKNFWIGFNNLSRSTATDSPQPGTWDNHQSKVWVNGKLIAPPEWKHGGQKGNAEIPLIDEGYEYREPTKILLQKGWNTVLIKAPVGNFKAPDGQNPVKWMFTFVPLSP